MKKQLKHRVLLAAGILLAAAPNLQAVDWVGGTGYWNDPANWAGGVIPDNASAWAIGGVFNNGTAIVTNTPPNVSEAWAGNNGVAGTIIVTNGGTLNVDNWIAVGRDGGGNTPLGTLIVDGGVINKRGGDGEGFNVGEQNNCKGQMFVRGNGRVNVLGGYTAVGKGWEIRSEGSLTLEGNGVFDSPNRDFNIADWGTARGWLYVKDNATLNISRVWIGKWDDTIGVIRQTGGAINGIGTSANEWCFGGEGSGSPNAFAYYQMDGGTLATPFNYQFARYGKGVFYQTGGTQNLSGWSAFGRYPNSWGVAYLTGGKLEHSGTTTRLFVTEQGRGDVTVAGTAVLETAQGFVVGNGTAAIANLNVNGGTVRVPRFERWSTSMGYVNLNGGTIMAKASEPAFMEGLTEVRVFAGNAVFDTAGNDITVSQPLVAPLGSGVASISLDNPGEGYLAPPIVDIQGDGTGASAVALLGANGTISSIVVTCPGVNYTTAFVNLIGGGATTPAIAGVPVISPLTSGGIVKNGAGTLTLAGANNFSGPSTVNGGKLVITSATAGGGSFSVAAGASLGAVETFANSQVSVASLNLAANSAVDFDLGAFGNPSQAPINVMNALNVGGTVTINIADSLPQVGQFPLIKYGSKTGSGNFVLGTRPIGLVAEIVDTGSGSIDLNITGVNLPRWEGLPGNTWAVGVGNWLDLSTSLATTYADGNAVLFNDQATGSTAVDLSGTVRPGSVKFVNDTLAYTINGAGKISGTAGVTKEGAGTVAMNTANDYTGTTRISWGKLAITNVANGGAPSPLGGASAAPTNLVIASGTLSYSGPAKSTDRGYTVGGTNSTIEVETDLTIAGRVIAAGGSSSVKTGAGKLTYTGTGTNELSGGFNPGYNVVNGALVFDGSGGQLNHAMNDFWVGSALDFGATIILTNNAKLNVDSWFSVGRGNGTIGNTSVASIYDSALRVGNFSMGWDAGLSGNNAFSILNLNGTSTLTNMGDMNTGESGGSVTEINLRDNSTLYSRLRAFVGWHNNGTGTLNMSGNSKMYVNAWFSFAHEGGTGTLNMRDNSYLWVLWDLNITDVGLGTGALNIQDNAIIEAPGVFIGKGSGSTGVANQTGGTIVCGNLFQVGMDGTGEYNLRAGTVQSDAWVALGRNNLSSGTLNVTGGSFNQTNTGKALIVGEEGTGVLTITNNGLVTALGEVRIAPTATSVGTVNVDGGTLVARRFVGGTGTSTLNLNGGLVRASATAGADFMSGIGLASVSSRGAIFDTDGRNITIAQALTDAGSTGNLVKLGAGTLTLAGANGYLGSTTVSNGTLLVNGSVGAGSVAVRAGATLGGVGTIGGPVTIPATATLAPGSAGVGPLTINNTLSLAGTTAMELDKGTGTNDTVTGLTSVTYGGTLLLNNLSGNLAPNDTFKLFSAGSYIGAFASVQFQGAQTVTWDTTRLTVDGTIKVVDASTATPTNITFSVSGDRQSLELSWPEGYTGWKLQAQTNALSIGINPAGTWYEIPTAASTNRVFIPIVPGNPTVFYRLLAP